MHIFTKRTLEWYKEHGRVLPWRQTTNPYHIFVSEFMLVQTQVSRVIPKYEAFLQTYPTIFSLAQAQLSDVLALWVGLGYNRRAKFLHRAAVYICNEYDGVIPDSKESLEKIPGIGPYIAGAICAFAYNKPVVVIDANIKRVYNNVFGLVEKEIPLKVEETVPLNAARDFYNALMDIGSCYYKTHSTTDTYPYKEFCAWYNGKTIPSLQKYTRSTFKDSNRFYRGKLIKLLVEKHSIHLRDISEYEHAEKYFSAISQLESEGFLVQDAKQIYLAK